MVADSTAAAPTVAARVGAAVEAARDGSFAELLELAYVTENAQSLWDHPDTMAVVVDAARDGLASDIKASAFLVLAHIAYRLTDAMCVCTYPGLVDVVMAAVRGDDDGHCLRSEALSVVLGIVCGRHTPSIHEAKSVIFDHPGLVETVLAAATGDGVLHVLALDLIAGLLWTPRSRARFYTEPGFVDLVIETARATENTADVREVGFMVLGNLADGNEVAPLLMARPGFRAFLLDAIGDDVVRHQAAWILCNLSNSSEAACALDAPDVLDALGALTGHAHMETRRYSVMAIANIVGVDAQRLGAFSIDSRALGDVVDVLRTALDAPGLLWGLYEPLLSLRSLCAVQAHRPFFAGAGLRPLLERAARCAVDGDDPRSCEYAVAALAHLDAELAG